MSEYISFSEIDIYSVKECWDENNNFIEENCPWTHEQIEAADFFSKMDWEGGIDGLMGYGGASYFPAEVREQAEAYEKASEELREALEVWGKERGVVY